MPYEFPEDYELLSADFFDEKHITGAAPGTKPVSATITNLQYNRLKMVSLIYEESVSATLAFALNVGLSQMEVDLKQARRRSEVEEDVKKSRV